MTVSRSDFSERVVTIIPLALSLYNLLLANTLQPSYMYKERQQTALDRCKSIMKKGIKTCFKDVLLCQHICNEISIQFTSFFVSVKVRVSGHKIRSIQQCVVSYNPMVLPEDRFLLQLCQTHERNPVWRDMGRLEQLEKTDGMCALKAHRCTVGFDTEHCCANLPKKRKRAKERMCQRRSLRKKIETTISMKTYPVLQQILLCKQLIFGCCRFDLCHTIFRIQYNDMLRPCVCYWVLGFFQTLQITLQYSCVKCFTGTSGIPVHFLLRDLVPERPSFCGLSSLFAYVIDQSLRNGNEFHLQHVSALSFLLK
jgi:hypothetical protein